jgi:hypothetical protein
MQIGLISATQLKTLLQDVSYLPDKCCTAILDSYEDKSGRQPKSLNVEYASDTPISLVETPLLVDSGLEIRLQEELEFKRRQAATKADDAEVPAHIWDQRILPHQPQSV